MCPAAVNGQKHTQPVLFVICTINIAAVQWAEQDFKDFKVPVYWPKLNDQYTSKLIKAQKCRLLRSKPRPQTVLLAQSLHRLFYLCFARDFLVSHLGNNSVH